MIRVLLVDDHRVVREGLKMLLADIDDISVCGEAQDGAEAFQLVTSLQPDVILIDIEMPVMNGLRCTELLIKDDPDIGIIAMSIYEDYRHVQSMIKAGARGYLVKNCGRAELAQAIRKVNAGGNFFSEDVTEVLVAGMQGKYIKTRNRAESLPRLSRREKEILKLIIDEKTTAEIAEMLFITPGTVETHRHNMMNKLAVRNTAGLVRVAITYQLV